MRLKTGVLILAKTAATLFSNLDGERFSLYIFVKLSKSGSSRTSVRIELTSVERPPVDHLLNCYLSFHHS